MLPRMTTPQIPNQSYRVELARLRLATQIARAREQAGLSQAALALRIGTKQAGVARMERLDYQGYRIETLAKVAAATGARLEVRLVPAHSASSRRPRFRTPAARIPMEAAAVSGGVQQERLGGSGVVNPDTSTLRPTLRPGAHGPPFNDSDPGVSG